MRPSYYLFKFGAEFVSIFAFVPRFCRIGIMAGFFLPYSTASFNSACIKVRLREMRSTCACTALYCRVHCKYQTHNPDVTTTLTKSTTASTTATGSFIRERHYNHSHSLSSLKKGSDWSNATSLYIGVKLEYCPITPTSNISIESNIGFNYS